MRKISTWDIFKFKVGEDVEIDGKVLHVAEGSDCVGCHYNMHSRNDDCPLFDCREVIFKEPLVVIEPVFVPVGGTFQIGNEEYLVVEEVSMESPKEVLNTRCIFGKCNFCEMFNFVSCAKSARKDGKEVMFVDAD